MEPVHTSIPEPAGFGALSKIEQIRYLQALWDRIAESPGDLPVPESHIALAEQRLADYRREPTRAQSAYDVFKRLGNKSR
jgi:putative addiction module component (TIGR02574 family)